MAVQMTLFAPKILKKNKLRGENHSIVLGVNRVKMFILNHWVFEQMKILNRRRQILGILERNGKRDDNFVTQKNNY